MSHTGENRDGNRRENATIKMFKRYIDRILEGGVIKTTIQGRAASSR